MRTSKMRISGGIVFEFLLIVATFGPSLAQPPPKPKYATSEQAEGFRGKSFLLVGDDTAAVIRGLDWSEDRSITLPFWLGTGPATPIALVPKEGKYYVISEAYIRRRLAADEWLIRAGSSLQKPDAVLITNKTRYKTTGEILPTIVQYIGNRTIKRSDGSSIDVPILQEVSLPMTWTKGTTPTLYAHYSIKAGYPNK
jgi:hypothetical protein